MRLAFSILHNAEHHLLHNGWGRKLAGMVDFWAVAVGACLSKGSTGWCKEMPERWHFDGLPIDDTIDLLEDISAESCNIAVKIKKGSLYGGHPYLWDGKDQMVNAALDIFKDWKIRFRNNNSLPGEIESRRMISEPIFLWEFDMDEQWMEFDLCTAEENLLNADADTGMFLADYWVGKKLQAFGEWGEGRKLPYRRLWRWHGQGFKTHEPPVLDRGNGKEAMLPQRFQHYAYYFERDVEFKDAWYGGHDGVLKRWKAINENAESAGIGAEWPVSDLITGPWGRTNTVIRKVR